jgi:hypothetical protein
LAAGKDPSQEKQISRRTAKVEAVNTFSAIARELIDKRAAEGMAPTTVAKTEWLLQLLKPRR